MTTTTAPNPAAPTLNWSRPARWAAAATLLTGSLLWVVAEMITYGRDRTAMSVEHPVALGISLTADLISVPFQLGTVLVWFLLSYRRAPRLAWTGAIAALFGLTGQAAVSGVEIIGDVVTRSGRIDPAVFSDVIDNGGGIALTTFFVMFFVGAFAGSLVATAGLWVSRAAPRGALLVWAAFIAVSIADAPIPTTLLPLISSAWIALALLRSSAPAVTVTA